MKYCILFLVIMLFGCETKDKNVKNEYYSTGEIKSIKRYKNKLLDGEAIGFYVSGNVREKTQFHKGKAEGYTYYFYPSGCLEGYRYYRNDKEVGIGLEYYDFPLSNIKSILHFNDSGQIFYKKNYDEHGGFLSEEGRKPEK